MASINCGIADVQYAVLRFEDGWKVLCNGYRAGQFPSAREAADLAERLSREARALGHTVELVVQEPGGELRSQAF